MAKPLTVLLIDDEILVCNYIKQVISNHQPEAHVEVFGDPKEGLERALKADLDVIITDLMMPGISGLDVIRELHRLRPQLPAILMTGFGNPDVTIEAGRLGVHEFLNKPFTAAQLIDAIESAAESYRLAAEPVVIDKPPQEGKTLVGKSHVMQEIFLQIGKIADSPVPVLIEGPTGSGKDLLARAIYRHGERASKPFIAINCAATTEHELETELFGYEKDAFPGAGSSRAGKLEQAEGGTLFLDNIHEMGLQTQAKFLRFMQEGATHRLGSQKSFRVNVRILASCEDKLELAVAAKKFRDDLYFRLAVVKMAVPGLEERREDIPLLVEYFLRQHGPVLGFARASILPEAMESLRLMRWPGNVRQLENFVRELILNAREHAITPAHVQQGLKQSPADAVADDTFAGLVSRVLRKVEAGELPCAMPTLMDMVEREIYGQAHKMTRGNRSKMSRLLGVSRPTVLDKISTHGIDNVS
ncbi:MAG: sigma-54 dependent transcriptional regulator [Candidatus Methylacidiphilales bacterium]|nr:sigma-54 dependent transcriptional regulator [Candidatus Methylacidiphilales bacterium]